MIKKILILGVGFCGLEATRCKRITLLPPRPSEFHALQRIRIFNRRIDLLGAQAMTSHISGNDRALRYSLRNIRSFFNENEQHFSPLINSLNARAHIPQFARHINTFTHSLERACNLIHSK